MVSILQNLYIYNIIIIIYEIMFRNFYIFFYIFLSMEQSIFKSQHHHRIIIHQQFVVNQFLKKIGKYNCYQGFNLNTNEKVTIYIKLYRITDSKDKEAQLNQIIYSKVQNILPKMKWTGEQKINNILYHINVFEKFGPSIKDILKIINYRIPESTINIIIYNMLRLIEKIAEKNFVYKTWKFSKVCLGKKVNQTDIFITDIIDIKKKGDQNSQSSHKYSSIGSHLGLRSSFKDDLQSLSYMIFDLYTDCTFFKRPNTVTEEKKRQYYLNLKSNLQIFNLKSIPHQYINFYLYCRNLSFDQSPNFQYWKKCFKKLFSIELLKNPYKWQEPKSEENDQSDQQDKNSDEKAMMQNEFQDESISQKIFKMQINVSHNSLIR